MSFDAAGRTAATPCVSTGAATNASGSEPAYHLRSICRKLGVNSRDALTDAVGRQKL
jgi:hypothetical protein